MSRFVAAYVLAACSFEHGTIVDAPADVARTEATLFVGDYFANRVHRLTIARGRSPSVTLAIPLDGALSPIIMPNGELLVSEVARGVIDRFVMPLAMPAPNGLLGGLGIGSNISKMIMIDGELWAVNPTASNVLRLVVEPQAGATLTGTVEGVTNGRGILFDAGRRHLYITQCCVTNGLLRFDVAPDHSVTPKPIALILGLSNPHGMVMTPWSELLVANAAVSSIARFKVDAAGNLTPMGSITGNNMAGPIDLVMTPWGELYVTNETNQTLSRFTFDAGHNAVAAGNFPIPSAQRLVWTAVVY